MIDDELNFEEEEKLKELSGDKPMALSDFVEEFDLPFDKNIDAPYSRKKVRQND